MTTTYELNQITSTASRFAACGVFRTMDAAEPGGNLWLCVTDLSQCVEMVKQYWEIGKQPPEGALVGVLDVNVPFEFRLWRTRASYMLPNHVD